MPSVLLSQPLASGPQILYSGNVFSGRNYLPVTGVQLKWDKNASGYAYVALSGGFPLSGNQMTINSGAMQLSGGILSGLLDGMQLAPGDSYFIPKGAAGPSGQLTIWAMADVACSGGFGRMFLEIF